MGYITEKNQDELGLLIVRKEAKLAGWLGVATYNDDSGAKDPMVDDRVIVLEKELTVLKAYYEKYKVIV